MQQPQQSQTPPDPPSQAPSPPQITPPLPIARKATPDTFRIHHLLEKERLTPCDQKPNALHFFNAPSTETITESKFTAHRLFSNAYTPNQLFGLAPSRKCEIREVPVTFLQIWNREVLWRKWDVVRRDEDGWLTFEEKGVKMQIQRHHGPGTLFFVGEGGDEGILEEWVTAPDVAFRLVDADGQRFRRFDKWDLQTEFQRGEEACGEGFVVGIDGREVKFEIEEGGREVRIEGEGMSKDWEGKQRGDLIVELV
jgi:hypothetical protein